jgi:hypothetical protein
MGVKQRHILFDAAPRPNDHQWPEEGGEQHQQDVEPVETDVVGHAPVGNPRDVGRRLQSEITAIELAIQPERHHKLQQHHAGRDQT